MPGEITQRSLRFHNFVSHLALDGLRHQIGAERKVNRAGALRLQDIASGSLRQLHLHRRSQRELARSAVLQLIEADVDVGQLNDFMRAVL
jgi:hypothetical protein